MCTVGGHLKFVFKLLYKNCRTFLANFNVRALLTVQLQWFLNKLVWRLVRSYNWTWIRNGSSLAHLGNIRTSTHNRHLKSLSFLNSVIIETFTEFLTIGPFINAFWYVVGFYTLECSLCLLSSNPKNHYHLSRLFRNLLPHAFVWSLTVYLFPL